MQINIHKDITSLDPGDTSNYETLTRTKPSLQAYLQIQ